MSRKFTHFVSIPAKSTIQDEFKNFKDLVLNDPVVNIVEESLFQVPEKLHLTICLMNLENDEDRQRAIECLNEVKDSVPGPIKIRFDGLNTFQRNHRGVSVVFSKVLPTNFSMFAAGICQKFIDKNLVGRQGMNSTYHLTLLNSKFLDKSVRRITNTFDATNLLDKYRNHSFGEMIVDELYLSALGTQDENGFYESIAKVNL